eukprot:3788781-Rhodomonas_salina.1
MQESVCAEEELALNIRTRYMQLTTPTILSANRANLKVCINAWFATIAASSFDMTQEQLCPFPLEQ